MTSPDLFSNLKNLMPGDTRTETIVVENTSTDYDYVKIYLRAEPASSTTPATTSGDISMSDFLSQLTLSVKNNDSLISTNSAAEPGTLSSNFLLGTFAPGDSTTLTVTLSAPSNLKNKYSHATGEVAWIFTTEGYKNGEPVDTNINIDLTPSSDPSVTSSSSVSASTPASPISLILSNSSTTPTSSSVSATATSATTPTTTQSILFLNLSATPTNPWLIAFLLTFLTLLATLFCLFRQKQKKKKR